MIDDAAWLRAVALLPVWAKARVFVSSGIVEIEWDREEMKKPYHDAADVRAMFFTELGGDWSIVDREHRMKTIVCRYRKDGS